MSSISICLSGRTVLITGASGGLGERFARITAASGAKVVLGARRIERLERIAGEIIAGGGRALALPLDVSDESSVIKAFDCAEVEFGTVDTVIANAGIEHSGSVFDISIDQFDQVFAVNVRGVFLTAREAARRMLQTGQADRGRIVLVSSITGQSCAAGILPYSASKAAVSHMGRLLAREWARTGPNVNCISPGYIATDINHEWFATEKGRSTSGHSHAGDFSMTMGLMEYSSTFCPTLRRTRLEQTSRSMTASHFSRRQALICAASAT